SASRAFGGFDSPLNPARQGRVAPMLGLAKPMNGINAPQRPDCVAGHVRLKLRNVVTKYPFERLHRFPVIQPNSGHRDYSRSSCDGGRRSSGLVPGSQRAVLTRTLVAENVISTDKSALLWMYCREIARGRVED